MCTLRNKPETVQHCIQFALALGKGYQNEGELSDVYHDGNEVERWRYVQTTIFNGFYDNLVQLKACAVDLAGMLIVLQSFNHTTDFFDKDSFEHVDFLFAAASLRAFQFSISV